MEVKKKQPLRHNMTITQKLETSNSWSTKVFVPFDPDYVVLKSLNYFNGVVRYDVDGTINGDTVNAELSLAVLNCPMLNTTGPIISFMDRTVSTPNLTFMLNGKSVNTSWSFAVTDISGNESSSGHLGFTLEFVKE